MALISDRTWSQLRALRTSGLAELQAKWSPCAFVAWTKDRPGTGAETWDNGKKAEAWEKGASGTGMLRANGSGGPVIGEAAIWQQAPYQFRTDVASGIGPNMWLVIDATRLFKVEAAPIEDPEKPILTAYLTELFGMALPEVTPVDDDEVTP